MVLACALVLGALAGTPSAEARSGYGTGVIVRFKHDVPSGARATALRSAGVTTVDHGSGATVLATPRTGMSTAAALRRLRRARPVAWAERSLLAGAAYVPNDSGVVDRAGPVGGWTDVQWELNGPFGIAAPEAWSQASQLGGSGGRGIKVAILDSGVAYSSRGNFARSPDLSRSRFVRGYDFIDGDRYPNDEYGHGTSVASIVGATANNKLGTVGVAYRARIMPVRVLDFEGKSDAFTIARGVRFAVNHGADVINMSLELFDSPPLPPTPRSIMTSRAVRSALRHARSEGVVVVSAAGNSFDLRVPGRRYDALAINVGGTTEHGCIGSYSNHGPGLDVVAPGGGPDASLPGDPNCSARQEPGRDISSVSFEADAPRRFAMASDFRGTSSAAPHVSGVAALVLASEVLGRDPKPRQVERHLERTARDLGAPGRDRYYGAGLVDATAATSTSDRADDEN
ncbi:MAG: S8 family serine peptidase [Solirubrobacteraceae bacterium]